MAIDPDEQDAVPLAPSRRWHPSGWAVWQMPTKVIGPVLTVELTAVAIIVVLLIGFPRLLPMDLVFLVTLGLLGIAHTEIALGVERVRRRISPTDHHDLSSVWTFAAVVVLPPICAVAVAIMIHSHLWCRAWRLRVPLYRHVFSTATIVLACVAASVAIDYVLALGTETPTTHLVALCLGLLVFTVVNSALVAGAIAVSTPQVHASQLVGAWDENLLEIATLCLGGIVAVTMAVNPWLVVMVLPPLLVLHRAVLVRHLEEAASTDGKTGLLNAAAWHSQAERELRRTSRHQEPRGVLVLDLDHFKAVNDTYGHLAGDRVLAAVADALRGEVRERDLVGRFGGEEFVVLLAGLEGGAAAELEAVGERIRRRIAALRVEIPTPDGPLTVAGLSVSIGGAVCPEEGGDLRVLLQIADAALYAAKRSGRNAVRLGLAVPAQPHPAAHSCPHPPPHSPQHAEQPPPQPVEQPAGESTTRPALEAAPLPRSAEEPPAAAR